MVQAALRLLEDRVIDEISIQDIAREAGTSVGSFLHRFGTKGRFFRYLLADMIDRRERAAMQELGDRSAPIQILPETLARGAISNFRSHAGLLRSAIRCHISGDDCWDPINKMAWRIVDGYVRRIASERGRPVDRVARKRITAAFVWLFGLLVHRTLRLNVIDGFAVPDKVFEAQTICSFRELIDRTIAVQTNTAKGKPK